MLIQLLPLQDNKFGTTNCNLKHIHYNDIAILNLRRQLLGLQIRKLE
jgi:hypothetical protein